MAECRCSGSNSSRAKLLSHFMQVPTSSVHSSTSFSSSAAAGYRRLLRVSRVVFKDHDVAIKGAREELRSNFYKNKDVTDQEELKKLLVGIDEVEEMLKFNIVQGERNERGNYDVKLNKEEHSVTVEAGQDNPLGQELKVIDQSILGKGVNVEKNKPPRRNGGDS